MDAYVYMKKTDGDAQVTARESAESVRQVFKGDQKLAVRNAFGKLNIPTVTAQRILSSTLKKKPYHILILHGLHEDYPRRAAMRADPSDPIQNGSLMKHVLFTCLFKSATKSTDIAVVSGLMKTQLSSLNGIEIRAKRICGLE